MMGDKYKYLYYLFIFTYLYLLFNWLYFYIIYINIHHKGQKNISKHVCGARSPFEK